MLLYEMLMGTSPFGGESEDDLFSAIQSDAVHYSRSMDNNAKDILDKVSFSILIC